MPITWMVAEPGAKLLGRPTCFGSWIQSHLPEPCNKPQEIKGHLTWYDGHNFTNHDGTGCVIGSEEDWALGLVYGNPAPPNDCCIDRTTFAKLAFRVRSPIGWGFNGRLGLRFFTLTAISFDQNVAVNSVCGIKFRVTAAYDFTSNYPSTLGIKFRFSSLPEFEYNLNSQCGFKLHCSATLTFIPYQDIFSTCGIKWRVTGRLINPIIVGPGIIVDTSEGYNTTANRLDTDVGIIVDSSKPTGLEPQQRVTDVGMVVDPSE